MRCSRAARVFYALGMTVLLVGTSAGSANARRLLAAGDAKLDSQLRPLVAPPPPLARPSSFRLQPLAAVRGSTVHVLVHLETVSRADLARLTRVGLKIERVNVAHRLVRGRVRTKDLRRLGRLAIVRSVEPVRPGFVRAGSVTSQGDAAAGAPQARATGFDGTGVTVGVISDGIDRLGLAIGSGNLPASTIVPPGLDCTPGTGDEGTAMLEIVHDLAPGAALRFSQGFTDKLAFVDSITCLRNAGAQVIVDDIGFFDEPFFEDGLVAEAVRAAVEAGVSYHSAAGNSAEGHYTAPFRATATSDGTLHSFAAGATPDTFARMDVAPGGVVQCVLQWNDPWGASANDYDLELWDLDQSPPALIDASENVQSGTQNPLEMVGPALNLQPQTGHSALRIRRMSGANRQVKVFCRGATNLQYRTPAGSIFGHPALTEVVAVGAIDASDFALNDVEPFSSQGPVTISFPLPETRQKPDLAGFDGVTTSICPSASLCFAPFFGTSAAAPHSAAVAALLLSKNACQTPAQVQQALAAGADDILAVGFDPVSGAGRLNAFKVLTAPWPCDDANACTRDTCTPATNCQHAALADGEACPDGDLCNGGETCLSGTCTPGAPLVCDDGSPCTIDSCSPTQGCVYQNACNDGDPCTVDTCDPVAGCQNTPAPDGTPCPDADLCNGTETCQASVCTPGAPLVCNDGDDCSDDVCDPRVGCQSPPKEGYGGVACLCARGLAPAICGTAAAPRMVAARFARACKLVARASNAPQGKRRARRLVSEAARLLGRAATATGRASGRSTLDGECAIAIERILADAEARTRRLNGF